MVVKFGRSDDVTRVLHAAQSLGWVPRYDVDVQDEDAELVGVSAVLVFLLVGASAVSE